MQFPLMKHFTRDLEERTRLCAAKFDSDVQDMELQFKEQLKSQKWEHELFFDHLDKEEQI